MMSMGKNGTSFESLVKDAYKPDFREITNLFRKQERKKLVDAGDVKIEVDKYDGKMHFGLEFPVTEPLYNLLSDPIKPKDFRLFHTKNVGSAFDKNYFEPKQIENNSKIIEMLRKVDYKVDGAGFYHLTGEEGEFGLCGLEIIDHRSLRNKKEYTKDLIIAGFSEEGPQTKYSAKINQSLKKIFDEAPRTGNVESLGIPSEKFSVPGRPPFYGNPNSFISDQGKYFRNASMDTLERGVKTRELAGWLDYIIADLPENSYIFSDLYFRGLYTAAGENNRLLDPDNAGFSQIKINASYKNIDFRISKWEESLKLFPSDPHTNSVYFSVLPSVVGSGQIDELLGLLKVSF